MPEIPNIDITPPRYGPPDLAAALFKMISGIPGQYREGQKAAFEQGQRERTERLQAPFVDEAGQPMTDFDSVQREMARRGMPPDVGLLWKQKYLTDEGNYARGFSPFIGGGQPTTSERIQQHTGGERPQPGGTAFGTDNEGLDTVRSLATERGIDIDTPGFKDAFAGIGLDRELPPALANAVVKRFDSLRQAGMWGPTDIASPSPAEASEPEPPTGMSPSGQRRPPPGLPLNQPSGMPAEGAPGSTPGYAGAPGPAAGSMVPAAGFVPPGGDLAEARLLQAKAESLRRLSARRDIAGIPAKAYEAQAASYDERAKQILDAYKQAAEPTGPQKEARDTQVNLAKAAGKLGEEVATAKGKRIGEIIEAGGLANRETVNTLNIMEDAMRHGGRNISTGPGAEAWLKVKQAANNIWPGIFQGVPEAETVVKLNAQLASQAAKAMTARPSQLEFKAFMSNNPGLMNSREGTFALINILRQAKEQELALSRHAMNAKNYDNWSDVEDRFFRDHPLKSPFTGKPLTSEAAGPPLPGARQAPDGKWYLPDPQRPGKYLEVR